MWARLETGLVNVLNKHNQAASFILSVNTNIYVCVNASHITWAIVFVQVSNKHIETSFYNVYIKLFAEISNIKYHILY